VTLKIERLAGRHGETLKLIGRIRAEHLPELKRQIAASAPSALELKEVALVDAEAVRFLGAWSQRAFISNIARHTYASGSSESAGSKSELFGASASRSNYR
jgi:ABC-type transporter Mla MlaB component